MNLPWMETAKRDWRLGIQEIRGPKAEPRILEWFAAVGHPEIKSDEVANCAAFVGCHLRGAGFALPPKTLRARSYLGWGVALDTRYPPFGAVVILKRGGGGQPGPEVLDAKGHVAFLWDWTAHDVQLLGANQNDQVNVSQYPRDRVLGVRWHGPR